MQWRRWPSVSPALDDRAGNRWGRKRWEGSAVSRPASWCQCNAALWRAQCCREHRSDGTEHCALLAIGHLAHFWNTTLVPAAEQEFWAFLSPHCLPSWRTHHFCMNSQPLQVSRVLLDRCSTLLPALIFSVSTFTGIFLDQHRRWSFVRWDQLQKFLSFPHSHPLFQLNLNPSLLSYLVKCNCKLLFKPEMFQVENSLGGFFFFWPIFSIIWFTPWPL